MSRTPAERADEPRDWWWIFDPRSSLRARAVMLLGGATLVFAVVIAALGSRLLRQQLEGQLGPAFETLAFQLADKIDRAIYERQRELQLSASLAPFRAAGISAAERRQLLENLQLAAPDFAWIGFADTSGRIVVGTGGQREGTEAGAREWFRRGSEAPFAGTLHEEATLGRNPNDPDGGPRRVLDLAVPVMAANGQFLGVLAAHVDWAWSRDVQFSVLPDSARRERLGATLYAANQEVLLDSGGSGWSEPPGPPTLPDARRFRGALVEETSGGTVYLTGYARSRGFRDYRGLGWLVTVRQPLERAFAPVREFELAVLRWGAVFVAFASVVAWLSASRLARRLRTIELAARRVREGDVLTVVPSPAGDGELERMSREVSELVEELRPKTKPQELTAPPLAKPAFSPTERMRNSV
jgi:HAMP domain-containing protein